MHQHLNFNFAAIAQWLLRQCIAQQHSGVLRSNPGSWAFPDPVPLSLSLSLHRLHVSWNVGCGPCMKCYFKIPIPNSICQCGWMCYTHYCWNPMAFVGLTDLTLNFVSIFCLLVLLSDVIWTFHLLRILRIIKTFSYSYHSRCEQTLRKISKSFISIVIILSIQGV